MCYQIPGSITKSGKPIVGGLDIDKSDFDSMATIYPKLGSGGENPNCQRYSSREVRSLR